MSRPSSAPVTARLRIAVSIPLLLCLVVAAPAVPAAAATLEARHGAVAAEHRLASAAGVEILQKGGNAVDAAVAAALATGVVNPSSSGIGGGGFLVLWDARHHKAATIDFREAASRHATETMYVRPDGTVDSEASKTGVLAVGIPGEPRGLALALKRYGKLKLEVVAAPAIRLAREGFPIEAHLASMIASGRDRLAADPELASVFLHSDGSPKREGETLQRPQLAATLERMAKVGADDFYDGELGAEIVHAVATWKGATPAQVALAIDAKDLKDYRAIERDPIHVRYRTRDVWSMPPPSSGGPVLAEALDVLSGWDVSKIDRNGPTLPHLLAETEKAVFADRATFYGDPAFTKIPLVWLLGPDHAREIRAKLDWNHAAHSSDFAPKADAGHDAGTSHISVVDADGNAASLTTSVNTGFGAGISVPGRDIVLNNTMDDFSVAPGKPNAFGLVGSKANAVAPGKRPLSSMTPTIVTNDGHVQLVAGASGGPLIITATLATLVGVVDFGLTSEVAVGSPRVHHQWLPEVLMVEPEMPENIQKSLKSVGHTLAPLNAKASVQAIDVSGTGDARVLHATSDPRKGGIPAGY
ncbi:MAG TPA: gamma-glutamyltransferase [Candidatus Binatia bacterium]|jgi:gamma-glutamyltranspeptidase/glutathione hydrolase